MKLSAIFLLLFPFVVGAQSLPLLTSTTKRAGYKFRFTSHYFATSSVVDSAGEEILLAPGESFFRWDNEGELYYGMSSRLEAFGGLRFRLFESIANDREKKSTTAIKASGVERLWIGMRYKIVLNPRTRMVLNTRFRKSLYSENQEASGDKIILGDPGNEVEAGGGISYLPRRTTSYSAYVGYRVPGNELSREIHYILELLWQKKGWGLALGADGIYSLKNDAYASAEDRPIQSSWGVSKLYNSFQREWLKPYLSVRHTRARWAIDLKASQVLHARSTDKGAEFSFGFTQTFGGETRVESKIKSFKEYLVEATVTKVSSKRHFVRIDAGLYANIKKGMKFDIYRTDFVGEDKLVASGRAYKVGTNKSIIRITEKYRERALKKGLIARGY